VLLVLGEHEYKTGDKMMKVGEKIFRSAGNPEQRSGKPARWED
jgi:hypothetical protein